MYIRGVINRQNYIRVFFTNKQTTLWQSEACAMKHRIGLQKHYKSNNAIITPDIAQQARKIWRLFDQNKKKVKTRVGLGIQPYGKTSAGSCLQFVASMQQDKSRKSRSYFSFAISGKFFVTLESQSLRAGMSISRNGNCLIRKCWSDRRTAEKGEISIQSQFLNWRQVFRLLCASDNHL
jgi:hypothetical protein